LELKAVLKRMISIFGIGYLKNFAVRHLSIISRVKSKFKGVPKYNEFDEDRNGVASKVILYEPQSLRDWLVIVI
jgi:hypothetical protein